MSPTLVESWRQVFFSLSETKRLLLGSPDIEVQDDCIIITFRDAFTSNLFVERHLSQIRASISELSGGPVKVIVRSSDSVFPKPVAVVTAPEKKELVSDKGLLNTRTIEPVYRSKPRPHFTFDDFVVGASNHEAYEAAQAVARWEDGFDTLFLTGPVGCGKTHLLWSAWRRVMETREKVKTCYVLASDFVGHFFRISDKGASRSEKLAFDNLYSAADLFLMDDMHDLIGRPGSQRQLRIFIEKLSGRGAYIMFSSKCPLIDLKPDPKDEKVGLVVELYSRLCGFLSARIKPPDFDLKVAILLSKVGEGPAPFELEIGLAQEIVRRISVPDVRPLEGIVKRLKVKVASGQKVSLAIVNELLGEVPPKKLDVEAITKTAAEYFSVSVEAIKSDNKMVSVVRARRVAFYLCRKLLPQVSTTDLGKYFKKDHSTVIQGASDIEREKNTNAALMAELLVIEGKIHL